jgi:hypothetical protein
MPPAKHREPRIPAKVKVAVKALLDQSTYDLPAAATEAGLSTAVLRRYMKRPEVLRFVREEKAALIEAICLSNPMSLAEVRSNSPNSMARVASARQLELMRTGAIEETGGPVRHAPGLVVIIQSPGGEVTHTIPPPPMQIELDPLDRVNELEPR